MKSTALVGIALLAALAACSSSPVTDDAGGGGAGLGGACGYVTKELAQSVLQGVTLGAPEAGEAEDYSSCTYRSTTDSQVRLSVNIGKAFDAAAVETDCNASVYPHEWSPESGGTCYTLNPCGDGLTGRAHVLHGKHGINILIECAATLDELKMIARELRKGVPSQ